MKIEILLENLPQLEGSEKQIAWAEDIRNEFIDTVKGTAKAYEENPKNTKRFRAGIYFGDFVDFAKGIIVKYFLEHYEDFDAYIFSKNSDEENKDWFFNEVDFILKNITSAKIWIDIRKNIENYTYRTETQILNKK